MSGRANGIGDRVRDSRQARRGGARPQQPSITRPIRGLDEVVMEEWHRKGHPIDPEENGIALKARVGEKSHTLGNLAPALARDAGQRSSGRRRRRRLSASWTGWPRQVTPPST